MRRTRPGYATSPVLEILSVFSRNAKRQYYLRMSANDDIKARMKAALDAKKNKKSGVSGEHKDGGSKIKGGQRSGGAPQVQRKAGPSGSGAAG